MPLSEHEQQLLDQIEQALYAEDPKFASTVRGSRLRRRPRRKRLQGIALFVLGVVLLVGGLILPVKLAGIPIISVVGFLLWFFGAVLLWSSFRGGEGSEEPTASGKDPGDGGDGKAGKDGKPKRNSLADRMEQRLRKRFESGE